MPRQVNLWQSARQHWEVGRTYLAAPALRVGLGFSSSSSNSPRMFSKGSDTFLLSFWAAACFSSSSSSSLLCFSPLAVLNVPLAESRLHRLSFVGAAAPSPPSLRGLFLPESSTDGIPLPPSCSGGAHPISPRSLSCVAPGIVPSSPGVPWHLCSQAGSSEPSLCATVCFSCWNLFGGGGRVGFNPAARTMGANPDTEGGRRRSPGSPPSLCEASAGAVALSLVPKFV